MSLKCRTCANVIYNMKAKHLFEIDNLKILMAIKMVVGTELESRPDLPSHICACCIRDLNQAVFHMNVFRERCIKTEKQLLYSHTPIEPSLEEDTELSTEFDTEDDNIKQDINSKYETLLIESDKLEDDMEDELMQSEDQYASDDVASDIDDISQDVDSSITSVRKGTESICTYSSDSQEGTVEEYQELTDKDNDFGQNDNCIDKRTSISMDDSKKRTKNRIVKQKLSNGSNSDGDGDESRMLCNVKKTYTSWKDLTEEEIIERRRQQRRGDYVCDQCGRHFTDRSNFKLHLLRHTGIKNFKCKDCNKLYYTEHLLQLHERIRHQGERPYACKHCNKTFNSSTTRLFHERSHTNTRPYSCEYCDKSFTSASGLKRHDLTHNGVRPFYCSVCNRTFQRNTHLKAHLRSKLHILRETDIGLSRKFEN